MKLARYVPYIEREVQFVDRLGRVEVVDMGMESCMPTVVALCIEPTLLTLTRLAQE